MEYQFFLMMKLKKTNSCNIIKSNKRKTAKGNSYAVLRLTD